jgi:hypothetical protein
VGERDGKRDFPLTFVSWGRGMRRGISPSPSYPGERDEKRDFPSSSCLER